MSVPGHAGGLAMVGENGPELVNMGPAQITDASSTRRLLSGFGQSSGSDALVAEIRALRSELTKARQDDRDVGVAQIQASKMTAKLLQKFDLDGLPATRT